MPASAWNRKSEPHRSWFTAPGHFVPSDSADEMSETIRTWRATSWENLGAVRRLGHRDTVSAVMVGGRLVAPELPQQPFEFVGGGSGE